MANISPNIFVLVRHMMTGKIMARKVQTKRRLYVKLNAIMRTASAASWAREANSAVAEIKYRKADSLLRAALRNQLLEAAE